ncbi:DMT family transporter [Actinocrispum sp. NPDC049592]|uniref:DMT family transporter n=1 Tax=Actinocrispum sp. NPDC049592 TaxID=3154835 RepID=UPI0034367E6D
METSHRDAPGLASYLSLLTTMILFGAAFTSSKVVVGQLPHGVAAALRFGGAAVILVVVLCLRPGSMRFSWRDLRRAGSIGLIGITAYNFFFFWGLTLAPAIDGSIIVPVLAPVLTALFFLVTGREPASPSRITGLVLGVAGSVVFFAGIGGAGSAASGGRFAGDLLYLAGAACWATYSILSKKVLSTIEPLRATTYATGMGALALIVIAVPPVAGTDWSSVSAVTWANVVFLAVGPTAIAYLLYYRALRSVSPVTATIAMFVAPVFGTVSSVIFLGESFGTVQLIGALITVAGAILAIGVINEKKVARDRSPVAARPQARRKHSRAAH